VSTVAVPRFQLIPGGRIAQAAGLSGGVAWRLLGPNNRELGRSALAFVDAEAAHVAIASIRGLALTGKAHVLHQNDPAHWAWSLDDGELVVATSGRGFRHERECRLNLEHFREAAPTAAVSENEPPHEFPWQRTTSVVLPSEVSP
jgi:hypothetical protein